MRSQKEMVIRIFLIGLCSICLMGCSTKASRWIEPKIVTYIDEEGKEQKKTVDVEHMTVGFGGKVDFEKGKLDAKQESPLKGIVDITGQKVLQGDD